jgi:hypothetical protein
MRNILCQGLVGYCFHCSNFAIWDDKLQKMICLAYYDGIPDSMWERVEAGKNCLYWKKDRLEIQNVEMKKQIEKFKGMKIPDEDWGRIWDKLESLILDKENIIDKTVRMRSKEFDNWLEKFSRKD